MKNLNKPLKEIKTHIVDQVYWHELWPLRSKIFKYLVDGEIDDYFWDDHDNKHSYKIDLDNRDIRLFLLDLIRELDSLEDEIDTTVDKIRTLISKTEKQGKTK